MKNISKMSVLILFLLGNSNFSFTQNAETGVDGLAIGSKQDNTYSAFVIHGPGFPLEGGRKLVKVQLGHIEVENGTLLCNFLQPELEVESIILK